MHISRFSETAYSPHLLLSFALLLAMGRASAAVVTYPAPADLARRSVAKPSSAYEVRVSQGGQAADSFVYEIPADKQMASRHNICSFTTFCFDGRVTVEVKRLDGPSIRTCSVFPRSYGITAEIVSSNTARFVLEQPNRKCAVIFDDDWRIHPLLVFGDSLERDVPASRYPDVMSFGPGVHDAGRIPVRSGHTIYLAGGAYVKGWIEEQGLRDAKVRGRGILSAETRPGGQCGVNKQTIYFNGDGANLLIEGITFVQSQGFACTARGVSNVIRNCKVVGNWHPTTDGFVMDDFGVVEDCFIKADDDAIKLYGSHGVARRCVIWQMENGGVFQLGWTRQNASHCRVSDMDIIRTEWTTTDRDARGIIASVGLEGAGGNHVFENIRVERGGGRILSLNLKPRSSATWTNVLIRNLIVDNWQPVEGRINGEGFAGLRFENYRLNGQLVTNTAQANLKILNGAAEPTFDRTTHIDDLCVHDPAILVDASSRTYFVYRQFSPRRWAETSTSGTNAAGVQAFWSQDLTNWYGPTNVFEILEGFWADREGPWAPEVHAFNGKYYLFTTFNAWKQKQDERPGRPFINKRASQILVADSPLGPFTPFANQPHTPPGEMTLDATFWVEDGQPWLVYCHEWVQVGNGLIKAIRLKPDLSATLGEPLTLFAAGEVSWARTNINYRGTNYPGIVTDGPWLHRKEDGKLLIFWSSWSHTNAYAQAVAVAESGKLAGPWRHIEPPLLWDDRGHGMVFRDFNGRLLLCLHRYFHQPKTRVQLWELEETSNAVKVKGQVAGAP